MTLSWQVGHSTDALTPPARWIPATVPGAVQLDWARAENWPPYWYAKESERYRWMEDVWWTYRTRLEVPAPEPGGTAELTLEGGDYEYAVAVDGAVVHRQTGLYTPAVVDLTACAGRTVDVEVRFSPAPKAQPSPEDRSQANRCFKPAVSYGWDFHPRLIPLGLWRPATFALRPALRLVEADVTYVLSDNLGRADVRLACALAPAPDARLRWTVLDPAGRTVAAAETDAAAPAVVQTLALAGPELWWPHDHGPQPLYTHVVQVLDAAGAVRDERRLRTGFRRARLVMYPGQWDEPLWCEFPKPRTHPPVTLEINGRPLFAKGANWVAPEIFPGTIDRARLEPLLRLARDSHFNLLRCWGGAAVMPEPFFDLADELGVMVWQEFTLACNAYPDDPSYLAVVDRESRTILRRGRAHPAVVLWCGGNELFNKWSGMDDQSLALRLLNRNCLELDPHTPFLPTSPVGGMAHGHYTFWDKNTKREVGEIFQRAAATAYTEFGVPGAATLATLRRILPPEELFPPREGTSWQHHHAFQSWTDTHHLCRDVLERYFGPARSLEELVAQSHWTQAEGYRAVYEEARRQKPRASMALAWCYNEPWPAAANLSLTSWPLDPKPALALVAAACRPVLASARLAHFQWVAGEVFAPELWLLNDTDQPLPPQRITATVEFDGRTVELLAWTSPAAPANTNVAGPRASLVLPPLAADRFVLRVAVVDHPEWDSAYTLSFRTLTAAEVEQRRMNLA